MMVSNWRKEAFMSSVLWDLSAVILWPAILWWGSMSWHSHTIGIPIYISFSVLWPRCHSVPWTLSARIGMLLIKFWILKMLTLLRTLILRNLMQFIYFETQCCSIFWNQCWFCHIFFVSESVSRFLKNRLLGFGNQKVRLCSPFV